MKRVTILIAAALLVCIALTACGTMRRDGTNTTSSTRGTTETTARRDDAQTSERDMGDVIRDNAETVSEMFSEGASELRDESFLDPQNGIISDTHPSD